MSNPNSGGTRDHLINLLIGLAPLILQSLLSFIGTGFFSGTVARIADVSEEALLGLLFLIGMLPALGIHIWLKPFTRGRLLLYILFVGSISGALYGYTITQRVWCSGIYPSFHVIRPEGTTVDKDRWTLTAPASSELLIEFSAVIKPENLLCTFTTSGNEHIDLHESCIVEYSMGTTESRLRTSFRRLGCREEEISKSLLIRPREG